MTTETETFERIPHIATPAESVAVGICVTARTFPEARNESHPLDGCRWCPIAKDILVRAIEYFEIVAEWDGDSSYRADFCREFYALDRATQQALVREAQAVPR